MTYLESYRQCKSQKELCEKVKNDVIYAYIINKDRLPHIEEALNTVANERGWDMTGSLEKE